jgi:excisionase family DNA binding protein
MNMTNVRPLAADAITDDEAGVAKESASAIANLVNLEKSVHVSLSRQAGKTIELDIPTRAVRMLAYILEQMAQKIPVTLVPSHSELSTIEAARLMGVSRPFIVKLLDEGKIPFRVVGSHRRVLYEDVVSFLEKQKRQRIEVLKELIVEQESLGLYE